MKPGQRIARLEFIHAKYVANGQTEWAADCAKVLDELRQGARRTK